MSVLPAGKPLARFLPDLDDLLHDPLAYLRQGPLPIGPRRMYGLAALFTLPGTALALSALRGDGDALERLAVGLALLVGASVWLLWSLLLRGHSLVLHPEGVEVRHGGTAVWCPWALFNAEGDPFVPQTDSPRLGLTLPIWREAIPFVELRRNEAAVAHGAQVSARQFHFVGSEAVVLPARYEVVAADLGHLLLQLGRRLGRELPRGSPPREAADLAALGEVPTELDPTGRLTVPLFRLTFPPVCCDCGQPTGLSMSLYAEPFGSRLAGLAAREGRPLTVDIPVCEVCQHRLRAQVHRGGTLGMAAGAGLGAIAALALTGVQGALLLPALIGGLAGGGLLGFLIGTTAADRRPVRVGRYSPSQGTVSLSFRNPDYAALVVEAMRSRAQRTG
jgi:hypothetical protein